MRQDDESKKLILGIDEVGRGCVAGPVMLGGVVLETGWPEKIYQKQPEAYLEEKFAGLKLVRDSKCLSESKRRAAAQEAATLGWYTRVLLADNRQIDTYGMGECLSHLVLLMRLLAGNLGEIDRTIIDGKISLINPEARNMILWKDLLRINNVETERPKHQLRDEVIRENKADDTYLSVALASNLAKVYRDDYMTHLGMNYPEYAWSKNKGYPTKLHLQQIQQNPENPWLRRSFLKKYLSPESAKSRGLNLIST